MEVTTIAALAALIILVVLVKSFGGASVKKLQEHPYEPHGSLLTRAERSFFGVLEQAVANNFRVFAKVRVADVLKPKKGLARGDWQSAFNKISAKHFDFVLCDPASLDIRAVVELNDKSHQRTRRTDRDDFLRAACSHAQVPLVVIAAKRGYSVEALRDELAGI